MVYIVHLCASSVSFGKSKLCVAEAVLFKVESDVVATSKGRLKWLYWVYLFICGLHGFIIRLHMQRYNYRM